MANFCGKWQLISVDGVQAFQEAIKAPAEYREKCKALYAELKSNPDLYYEELSMDKSANTIQRKLTIKGEVKRNVTIPIGVDHKTTAQDGRNVTVNVKIESDNKAVLHEKGDGFELQSVFEVHGNDLVLTNKAGSAVATLKYKRA